MFNYRKNQQMKTKADFEMELSLKNNIRVLTITLPIVLGPWCLPIEVIFCRDIEHELEHVSGDIYSIS